MKYLSPRLAKIVVLFLIVLGTLSAPSSAQVKYSNEFLSIGVGARAHGMANAVAANVSDVTATYWNPAGLSRLKAPLQVGAMHAEWFAGIAQYDYLAFAKPMNKDNNAAFGLSVIRLGIDQIPNTLNLIGPDNSINYDNVTEFSAADYALGFSYAQDIIIKDRRFALGGSAKVIRRVIGTFGNAWGFGLDAGLQYHSQKWRFALVGRDLTGTYNAWSFSLTDREKQVFLSTNNVVPESTVEVTRPRFILGVARYWQFKNKLDLLAELDLDFTTDGQRNVLVSSSSVNIDPHLGVELGYNRFIFIRGGVNNFQEALDDVSGTSKKWTFQPNFGMGLKLGRFHIDYTLTDIGNVSQVLYSHIFSLALDFKTRSEVEN